MTFDVEINRGNFCFNLISKSSITRSQDSIRPINQLWLVCWRYGVRFPAPKALYFEASVVLLVFAGMFRITTHLAET